MSEQIAVQQNGHPNESIYEENKCELNYLNQIREIMTFGTPREDRTGTGYLVGANFNKSSNSRNNFHFWHASAI